MYFIDVHYLFVLLSLCFYGTGSYGEELCSSCQCPYVPGESLDCSGRGITNITECEPLDGCHNATTMNFSRNAITEVSVIPNFRTGYDCHLDFTHNAISKGSFTFFHQPCRSLTLDLSFNAFVNISASSFGFNLHTYGLKSVTLNISQNQIQFIEPIPAPCTQYNVIENVTVDLSFNNLVILSNALFDIYPRPDIIGIIYVLLNDNYITHFSLTDFLMNRRGPTDATFIDLSNNYMSSFSQDDMSSDRFNGDIRLDLSMNRWNCNCSQRPISDSDSSLRDILIKEGSVPPVCADPPSVRGRPILSLSAEEFICSPEVNPTAPLQQEASRGETVKMTCPFEGEDPPAERVDWEFTPKDSQESGKESTFRFQSTCVNCPLVIENVQEGAEGEYRCTVSNGVSLTIRQTLRLVGAGEQEMTLPPMSPSGEETMNSPTTRPTGSAPVVVVIVIGTMWILTTISLIVVGYKFYHMKREGVKANTDVAAKYQNKPRGMPHSPVQAPGRSNGGYEAEKDSYEVPKDIADGRPQQQLPGEDKAIHEVNDSYVNVKTYRS